MKGGMVMATFEVILKKGIFKRNFKSYFIENTTTVKESFWNKELTAFADDEHNVKAVFRTDYIIGIIKHEKTTTTNN